MAKCKASGKTPQFGNNVPFSLKKTRKKWDVNVQKRSIYVPELGRTVRIKLSARALRSVDKLGLMPYLRKQGKTLKDVL